MSMRQFSPRALSEARIARGLNKAQLANAIGMSRQAISLNEKGENEPKPETVGKIAEFLHLPLAFFYREPPPAFKMETPAFYRDLSKTTAGERERAITKAGWHYQGYLKLTQYLKPIPIVLPNFCFEDHFDFLGITNDLLEDYAKKLRSFWGLGLGPIVGLTPLLERNGVLVFQIELRSGISGFSFFANDDVPFIITAKGEPPGRNRFNLAHELAHLLLHAEIEESELERHEVLIENQAHYFAGAFLFPKERFLDEFISLDLNYLASLKQRWGMSMGAMVVRAAHLEIITREDESNFYRRHLGIRKREPGDDQTRNEHPTFPPNGLKALLGANQITIDDLKSELPYGNDDLAEIFCVEKTIFDKVESAAPSNIIQFQPKF